jgi:hypothetical protein
MNLQILNDQELVRLAVDKVALSLKIETEILHILAEIYRRRSFSRDGHSMFSFCTEVLKMSCNSANLRISNMFAMKLIPEIEEKLQDGSLNLSNIAIAQKFFKQEKKKGKVYSLAEKKEVLQKFENKSGRECIMELVKISPDALPKESRRQLSEEKVEIKIVVDQKLIEMLDQIKSICSHKNPSMTDSELIQMLAEKFLEKPKPRRITPSSKEGSTRYIPAHVKREVRLRDKNTCTYPGCKSKHQLEFDHSILVSMGGKSTTENLRILCKVHNQLAAIEKLGLKKMNKYLEVGQTTL